MREKTEYMGCCSPQDHQSCGGRAARVLRKGSCDAGESLCRRLAGNTALAEALLSRAIDPWAFREAARHAPAADGAATPPLQSSPASGDEGASAGEAPMLAELLGVSITAPEDRALLESLMRRQVPPISVAATASGMCDGAEGWGEPLLSELAVQVPHGKLGPGALCSRSYVRQVDGETRLATVLVSDDTR